MRSNIVIKVILHDKKGQTLRFSHITSFFFDKLKKQGNDQNTRGKTVYLLEIRLKDEHLLFGWSN